MKRTKVTYWETYRKRQLEVVPKDVARDARKPGVRVWCEGVGKVEEDGVPYAEIVIRIRHQLKKAPKP